MQFGEKSKANDGMKQHNVSVCINHKKKKKSKAITSYILSLENNLEAIFTLFRQNEGKVYLCLVQQRNKGLKAQKFEGLYNSRYPCFY